jgi:hypothetical protein
VSNDILPITQTASLVSNLNATATEWSNPIKSASLESNDIRPITQSASLEKELMNKIIESEEASEKSDSASASSAPWEVVTKKPYSKTPCAFDPERFLKNLMRLIVEDEPTKTWEVVKCAYYTCPTAFEILGTPHCDYDGGNTRLHLRWTINDDNHKNFHIYGYTHRGGFCATRIVLFIFKNVTLELGSIKQIEKKVAQI